MSPCLHVLTRWLLMLHFEILALLRPAVLEGRIRDRVFKEG